MATWVNVKASTSVANCTVYVPVESKLKVGLASSEPCPFPKSQAYEAPASVTSAVPVMSSGAHPDRVLSSKELTASGLSPGRTVRAREKL